MKTLQSKSLMEKYVKWWRMRRGRLQKHLWGDLDTRTATTRLILWPTSTYIPSNPVPHMRFEDSPNISVFLLFLPLCVLPCPLSLFWFDSVLFFMQVHNWPVGPLGLLYDRGWMVVNGNGVCLSQKRVPHLCLIRPQVHLPSNKLLLQASGRTVCQQLSENTHAA